MNPLTLNTQVLQYIMIKDKVGDIDPTTTGHSKTLTFPTDKVQQGTQQLEWHTVSADGHEISDRFEFSVGKKTANGVDTSPAFYENLISGLGYSDT